MDVERDEFVEQGYGMHFYRGLRIGPLGCRVKHGPLGTEEERCTVDLASKAMECVGTRDLIEGLRALSVSEIRWQVPRADVALDGVGCHPDDAGAIFRGGTVRKCRAHRSSNGRKENRDGVTVYIGDRHSPRFLRVYNRRGPTRFELECKDEAAGHVVFGLMVREASEWGDYLRGVLLDFVDFGAPWWAAAMAGVVPVRLPLRRVRDLSIEDKMRWLERSVSRTLAEVGIACDWAPEVLQGLIDKGYRKAGNRRRLH
jgi:DNA relaxase NicK